MQAINMLEAKTPLSRWVEAIGLVHGREGVTARSGRPVARLFLDETDGPRL